MNTFTNLNEVPKTELTPEELAMLAQKDAMFVTTDDADEDEVAEPAVEPTLN